MKTLVRHALLILVPLLALGGSVRGEEPPSYFRSDGGLALPDEFPLPDRFDAPTVQVWRQEMDAGHSTPCVWGPYIFLTTQRDQELATVALDRQSGKVLWRRVAPTTNIESFHPVGSPAAATAACDGTRLYVFFGSYGLLCYGLDGTRLWTKPMGPFQDEFGAASSPILVDERVILNQDHDINSFLTVIDGATGKTQWTTSRPRATRSYATPIIWDAGRQQQIVVAGALQVAGYDLESGRKMWWINGLARIVSTTPVSAGEMLYVATWSPGGDAGQRISMEPWPDAVSRWDRNQDSKIGRDELPEGPVLTRFFRIDLDQDGRLSQSEWNRHAEVFRLADNSVLAIRPLGTGNLTGTHVVWKYPKGVPYVPSPLHYRDILFLVKDGGIATALDPATGKVLRQARLRGRGNYYASPVGGDGKVYMASERGVMTVLSAEADWKILSSYDFGKRIYATPVIRDGHIYLRTEDALYCFRR